MKLYKFDYEYSLDNKKDAGFCFAFDEHDNIFQCCFSEKDGIKTIRKSDNTASWGQCADYNADAEKLNSRKDLCEALYRLAEQHGFEVI